MLVKKDQATNKVSSFFTQPPLWLLNFHRKINKCFKKAKE